MYGGMCNNCHQGVPRKCPPQPPAGPPLPPSRARLLSRGARLPGAQQDTGRGHVDLQLRALVSALGTWTRGLGAQRVTAATQPAAWTPGVAAAAGHFLGRSRPPPAPRLFRGAGQGVRRPVPRMPRHRVRHPGSRADGQEALPDAQGRTGTNQLLRRCIVAGPAGARGRRRRAVPTAPGPSTRAPRLSNVAHGGGTRVEASPVPVISSSSCFVVGQILSPQNSRPPTTCTRDLIQKRALCRWR